MNTIETLVGRAKAGDRAAMEELYQHFAPMVAAILRNHLPEQDVSDVTQEVFLQAIEKIAHLREPQSIGAWLAAIARRKAADHYRAARPNGELRDNTAAPAHVAEEAESSRILDTVDSLPEAYRETMRLRLIDGMTGHC